MEGSAGAPQGRSRGATAAAAFAAFILLGAAGVASAGFYGGTAGDDVLEIKRSGSVSYLREGNDIFKGAKGMRGHPPDQHYGGSDHAHGGPGDDRLFGRTYADLLRGQGGDDLVVGGGGRDELHGGRGNDTLKGGPGTDLFRPGRGRDICVGQRKDYGFPGFSPGCAVVRIRD